MGINLALRLATHNTDSMSGKVIIVGAGLSGLTAAALLAKQGMEVTVFESGDRPGGSCSAFRRDGITWDTGAAMLFGFGEKGFNPHRWLMGVLGEPIDVYRHEALYRLNYGDDKVTFWPDIDRFLSELGALFPEARRDLARFYARLAGLYERVIAKVSVFEAPDDVPADVARARFRDAPLAQIQALRLLFRDAESLMRPYVKSGRARRFFDKLTSTYCYTTLRETPAMLAATMFIDNHVGGSYYPAGSAMSLAARLEKAVEKFGGSIRYRSRVVSLHSDGRADGVLLDSGEFHRADAVLFTAAVKELAERLDPDSALPLPWKKRILAMEDSFPSFIVYGTVEKSVLPAGILPVEMFIDNRESLDEADVTLYVPSLEDPGLCPEDLAVFELIGPSMRRWPRPWEAGYGSAEYAADKRSEADRMLALVERRIPGFIKAIKARIEGSPSTIERYLGKPRGSIAGPKQKMGQHLLKRQRSRGPLPGLYFAGEGTVMGTGTPAVTVSGISAANRILREFGLQEYKDSRDDGRDDSRAEREGNAGHKAGEGNKGNADRVSGGPACVRIIPRGTPGNLPEGEAAELASKCRWCESPPCAAACPARPDIPGIMRRLEAGNLVGALRAMKEAGLPEACGECRGPEGVPACESACARRTGRGKPVEIRLIVRLTSGTSSAPPER